ncbi:tRNA (N(6)-L-threonylcarbamoyladenosine(37)-C(2))-methylthiotransferase MtaB [Fonticella tunisiensis]|uniref:Threonylcarbamoyladenosine tRNA methylthiotransferase MtaB n=1 Tax=Fonticella tunisiensis TaxID=1096341 RepID=A0A4R7KBN2_9CLOT|nr:tRNA (N(6)-L-threonylcarbamoyladenosine(37)-C(2))-methylthiotransferase MtaB [Fonticella tunisiensis]TDT51103.1 threonylcarbamoyladenosine tRNA methylthiotransferase MtaB [Fonticella tunisiensis]
MNKAAFYTLGCRVNTYETEAIMEMFIKNGYEIVDFDQYADVYIINTCTVTKISDKKSRQMIRKAKKLNPKSVVAAVGCYVQVAPDEVASIDGVDIIVGTSDKGKILKLIDEYKKNKKQVRHIQNIMNIREFEELEIDEYHDKTRAFLKIQDGCDRFCSYCLIPFARGPVRSRGIENIEKEVKKLSERGFKEIILSGIHVASYGKDIGNINLVDVIELINGFEGIERIRIGSIDPTFFSDEVIERLEKLHKFCPHFHLSLQSGCDETLKRMNRHYTTDDYRRIVNKIRDTFEDVSITTDIIVGFPGETDEEFKKTYEFLKDIKLSKMHIFKYSPRKGTRAEKLENQVSPEDKERRSKILIELDNELERRFIERFVGRNMKVLFEEGENGLFKGYTTNYIKVECLDERIKTGEIYEVKLVENKGDSASGILLS